MHERGDPHTEFYLVLQARGLLSPSTRITACRMDTLKSIFSQPKAYETCGGGGEGVANSFDIKLLDKTKWKWNKNSMGVSFKSK